MPNLKIQTLESERVAQCFPLVHLTAPGMTASAWQEYAEAHLAQGYPEPNGILVAEKLGGCILGLAVYSVDRDPLQGRTLLVKNLIAHDYFASGRRQVEQALISAIETLARLKDCRALHVIMPAASVELFPSGLHDALESEGHKLSGLSYCKPLPPTDRTFHG